MPHRSLYVWSGAACGFVSVRAKLFTAPACPQHLFLLGVPPVPAQHLFSSSLLNISSQHLFSTSPLNISSQHLFSLGVPLFLVLPAHVSARRLLVQLFRRLLPAPNRLPASPGGLFIVRVRRPVGLRSPAPLRGGVPVAARRHGSGNLHEYQLGVSALETCMVTGNGSVSRPWERAR